MEETKMSTTNKASSLEQLKRFASRAKTEAEKAAQAAVAASGHAHFEKVAAVPEVEAAQENTLYLVKNADTGHYDIYAKVAGDTEGTYTMELLDDTTVDLSGYITTEALSAALDGKVDAVEGKVLSSNDYTDEDKAKLDGISFASDEEFNAMLDEVYGSTGA